MGGNCVKKQSLRSSWTLLKKNIFPPCPGVLSLPLPRTNVLDTHYGCHKAACTWSALLNVGSEQPGLHGFPLVIKCQKMDGMLRVDEKNECFTMQRENLPIEFLDVMTDILVFKSQYQS